MDLDLRSATELAMQYMDIGGHGEFRVEGALSAFQLEGAWLFIQEDGDTLWLLLVEDHDPEPKIHSILLFGHDCVVADADLVAMESLRASLDRAIERAKEKRVPGRCQGPVCQQRREGRRP